MSTRENIRLIARAPFPRLTECVLRLFIRIRDYHSMVRDSWRVCSRFNNDWFVINTKSNTLSSLIGSLCICEWLNSDIISVLECFKHSLSQSMSGQLKYAHKNISV